MYHRYVILAIILLPLFMTPAIVARPVVGLTARSDTPTVESRLKAEIQSSSSGIRALLEFQDTLTNTQIIRAESMGIKFVRRGSTIVNVGNIYSAMVQDVSSLEELSSLGLIRATSGSKQYVPSITSSVPAIKADEVW
ncbi:MAG: hypothetical protein EAX87_11730, partial [Candidatus Thorarchaeota archaeon]|nr:hypothetical protein [Candidatus Thorarchaeota archaeon]